MHAFDVVVLGGGSGSQVATVAANEGYEAAVVEPGPLGGACITRGCVPSKALIHRADLCETIRRAGRFGVDAELRGLDYEAVVESVHETVFEKANRQAETLTAMDGLTRFEAVGRFVDDRTIRLDGGDADGERIRGEHVVIAGGGRPTRPPIDGIDETPILTSDEALFLDEQPDSLAVVGGGYIGAELGHFFDAVGTDVSIVGRSETLVPRESRVVSEAVTRAVAERCDVHTEYEATEVRTDGEERILVATPTDDADADSGSAELRVDQVLIATGRRPNTDDMGLGAAGIETTDDGHVEADETLETAAPGVWALGDVLPADPYKHVADREAEVVAANVLAALGSSDDPAESEAADEPGEAGDRAEPDDGAGTEPAAAPRETMDRTAIPHAIFTEPRVASVGKTAAALDEEEIAYDAVRVGYDVAPLGLVLDTDEAFVEVLAGSSGDILGCHVVGPEAPVLIQEVVTAMTVGEGTVDELLRPIRIHPALSETVLGALDELASRTVSTAPDWRDVAADR